MQILAKMNIFQKSAYRLQSFITWLCLYLCTFIAVMYLTARSIARVVYRVLMFRMVSCFKKDETT